MTWSPPTMGNISLACFVRANFNRIKKLCPGLPWWSSGWESTCQGRGHRFDLWAEKIPCASGHLRPSDTATKPKCQEPVSHEASHRDERPAQAVKAPNSQKSKYVHEYTTFFFNGLPRISGK